MLAPTGDELTCCTNKMPFANLTAVINTLRAELGPGIGMIYTNDGPGTEGTAWPDIPAGLDRLSFDLYLLRGTLVHNLDP